MTKNVKNRSVVDSQLPNFIRNDYPVFVEFLKAYYDYLDSQKIHRNIESMRDVDTTLDEFVKLLKNELAQAVPNYANNKFYLPLQGQHYVTRGTEESYKLLFKMLLEKDVEIIYPSESVLRVSDGKWTQDISVFVKITAGDITTIVGKFVYVTASNKSVKIYVERINRLSDTVYEVFFSRNYFGTFAVGDAINFGTFAATIVPTTVSAQIIKHGVGFRLGQIFAINTNTGSGTIAKVSKVGVGGTIEQLQFIEFGTGYLAGSYYSLSSKTPQATPYSFPLSQRISATNVEAGYGAVLTDYTSTNTVVLNTTSGTITLGARVKLRSSGTDPSGGETYVFSYDSGTKTVKLSKNITITSGTELSFSGTQITYTNPYPGYRDKTEGFVDGGYVNQQTYFDYTPGSAYVETTTTTTNVSDPIHLVNVTGRVVAGMAVKISGADPEGGATTVLSYDENTQIATFSRTGTWIENHLITFESLPLYTEGNYAGEVVREFYALTVEDEIDDNAALVEIKIGPVARYPGYYYNNDSFVSGLSYIQDSYYYQDFSYVIKVNEQLDTYKNIVLSYLHPVGKKMFAEYVIENKFAITPDIIISIIRKQFPEIVTAFETMDMHIDKQPFYETSHATHSIPVKNIAKSIVEETLNFGGIAEGQHVNASEILVKLTSKLINNSTLDYDGIADGQFVTSLGDITAKDFSKLLNGTTLNASGVLEQHKVFSLDSISAKDFGKTASDASTPSDTISSKGVSKPLADEQIISEQLTSVLSALRTESDTQLVEDTSYFTVGKESITSSSPATDVAPTKLFGKELSEEVINNDSGTAQWNPYYSQDYFLQDYQVGRRTF